MFNLHDRFTLENSSAGLGSLMNRTLIEQTYAEGYITSGKCSVCGQQFTTSAVALAASEDAERELVGVFGRHQCTPASKSGL